MTKSEFTNLYNQHAESLYYYALGFVEVKEVAEEILQETFLRIFEKKNLTHITFFYLYNIIRNKCLNYIRDCKTETSKLENFVYDSQFEELSSEQFEELLAKADAVLKKLPEKCRNIFLMSVVYGYKQSEIAEELDISVNTVKTQIRIAKEKIPELCAGNSLLLSLILNIF